MLYKLARQHRNFVAIKRCFQERSLMPIARRLWNIVVGRTAGRILNKLWWKK